MAKDMVVARDVQTMVNEIIGRMKKMKLTDLMNNPLRDLVEQCEVTSVKPISDDSGNVKKIIIEYEPHDTDYDIKVPNIRK